MARIKLVRHEAVPEPTKVSRGTRIVSEPQSGRKHLLQFISDVEGNNWRCLCGHVYPRPPIEVLLTNGVGEWLDAAVTEHEHE